MVAFYRHLLKSEPAAIALQQAMRHVGGGETNLELALTAHIVPELELDILELTKEG